MHPRIIFIIAAVLLCTGICADAQILTKGEKARVMPVGDSITLGKSDCLGGYRRPLYEWLIANGYPITYVGKENRLDLVRKYPITCSDGSTPWHEGYGSFRTDMILNGGTAERRTAPALSTTLQNFKPDVVLLMIGTNDILQGYQLDTLNARLEEILDTIFESNPKISVLVASIPPITSPKFAGTEVQVLAYNAAIPGIVKKQSSMGRLIGFVDVFGAIRDGGLSGDGVHPASFGYAKIAQAWYQALTGQTPPAIDRNNPLLLPPPLAVPQGAAPATGNSTGNTLAELAANTGAMENKAPGWIRHGAYVYRVCVPEDSEFLVSTEAGIGMTYNLLDRTIEQIPLMTGVISDDHTGICNWDGIWPYWSHVSYRAKNWDYLRAFMERVHDKYNTKVSFHVNLTDVNVGLRAYPETRDFFKKLVDTKSIYRRDINPVTRKRDLEPAYVPQDIPADEPNTTTIFALVNYKNFWDSGLAKQMIDDFYSHLPYAPPVLYVDVLALQGSNFTTGFPTGQLGGSQATQLEGVLNIAQYLRSNGTEIGTEGDRTFMGDFGTYGWLHCQPGYSSDDYSKIKGAAKGRTGVVQHVYGNTGCFVVAPVASTPDRIARDRAHYAALLAGTSSPRRMPGLDTWHLSDRGADNDEFNMFPKGGGDPFRGDWVDLVNEFYLVAIQELYHIGNGSVRTSVFNKIGYAHISKFVLTAPDGKVTEIPVANCLPPSYPRMYAANVLRDGQVMVEGQLVTSFNAPKAGKYRISLCGSVPGGKPGALNVYVNQRRQIRAIDIPFKEDKTFSRSYDLGEITLNAGANTLSFDPGPIYVKWSDGTEAVWETPSLGTGFKVTNGDVTLADDYDRMWPDTWSGQKKIYFFSWDGTARTWKLPQDWASVKTATLCPLTPDGRGKGVTLPVTGGSVAPKLLPQVPCILVPSV